MLQFPFYCLMFTFFASKFEIHFQCHYQGVNNSLSLRLTVDASDVALWEREVALKVGERRFFPSGVCLYTSMGAPIQVAKLSAWTMCLLRDTIRSPATGTLGHWLAMRGQSAAEGTEDMWDPIGASQKTPDPRTPSS